MAKKSKLQGLQKLRFYCQMCQKQCRDENGFKCHAASEGHLRQMQLFAESANETIDDFSNRFKTGFLDILSHRHSSKRIDANKVYQEYIAFKEHIHMNATIWTSLSEFVKYLGRESLCIVEETEQGWFVQYIDRDPRAMARQALSQKTKKAEMDDEERTRRRIEAQIAAVGGAQGDDESVSESRNLTREEGEKVTVSLNSQASTATKKRPRIDMESNKGSVFENNNNNNISSTSSSSSGHAPRQLSNVERIMLEEEQKRKKEIEIKRLQAEKMAKESEEALNAKHENWIFEGIYVKIKNKEVAEGKFFKKKGLVTRVVDDFLAEIDVDGSVLRLDQDELETVIPKVGNCIMILNGRYRGSTATLVEIDQDSFSCTAKIDSGANSGQVVKNLEYEDISKFLKF